MSGIIEAICISAIKGERKKPLAAATFIENHGIESDAHAGPWHRQVSLLAAEDVAIMRAKGLPNLQAGDFAENLLLKGIDLDALGLGSRLQLGDSVVLSLTQIGKECHSRCTIYEQTGDCIMPRRGLFARVTKGGTISVGDPATVRETVSRDTFQCVVLTASDRCSSGKTKDTAGPAVAALLQQKIGAHLYASEILPDDRKSIGARLCHYCDGHSIDLVLVAGGTGFAARDVTPEAARDVIERFTPGLDEAMRQASRDKTPHAMLSRAVSGIRRSTLIITLPGSERAAVENLEAALPALDHGLRKLRGDPADCGRPEEKGTANERE